MGFLDQFHLTRKQRLCAELAIRGKSNGEIGSTLGISEKTVKFHLYRVYRKIGVETRYQLMAAFFETDQGKSKP